MKKLLESIPIVSVFSALLVATGYMYLAILYKRIGVEIYSYVNAGEVVFSFLPIFLSTILIVILAVIFANIAMMSNLAVQERELLNVPKWLNKRILWAIIIFLFILTHFLPFLLHDKIFIQINTLLLLGIVAYFLIHKYPILDKLLDVTFADLALVIYYLIYFTSISAILESQKRMESESCFAIEMKTAKYDCSQGLTYFGRTHEYTFLFNQEDSSTLIIPNRDIVSELRLPIPEETKSSDSVPSDSIPTIGEN